MKRWAEQGEAGERLDPLEAELAALLALSPRHEVNPFVKRRVLVNVSRGSSRGRLPARRAAFAAVLLVAGSAGAAAVGRSDWGERRCDNRNECSLGRMTCDVFETQVRPSAGSARARLPNEPSSNDVAGRVPRCCGMDL